MKPLLRSLLLSLFFLPAALHASTTEPMFAGSPGMTLTIHGETYTWTSATEDAIWHVDTYTNTTTLTVTVTGKLNSPNLATVSGSSSTGTVAGYLSGGVYGDNHQTSSSNGSWQFDGVTYTHRNLQQDYSVDWNLDGLNSSGSDDYTGPDGHLHNTWNSPAAGNGFTQSTFSDGKTPFSGRPEFTVFGKRYTFSKSSSYSNHYHDGDDAGWTDKYESTTDEGILEVKASNSSSYWLQIWDPDLGGTISNILTDVPNSSLTGITWPARTAPTFAKPQLWLDGKLLNWQLGTITTEGLVTDSYNGAGVTLTISAMAHDFFGSLSNAQVAITSAGGGTGNLGRTGPFTLSGHVLQNASINQSAPLFTGSKTILRRAGANYAFTGGFQDSLGNRIDIYTNPSYGKIVLNGSASIETCIIG